MKYSDVRFADEQQFSVYNFEMADVARLWQLFDIHEAECQRLIDAYESYPEKSRFPVLPTYDQTHSDHVCDAVWALYDRAIRRCGAVSTLIEWDEAIPEWPVLEAEAARAKVARGAALDNRREAAS